MFSKKEFDNVVNERFSCRSFKPERITTEELNYVLEVGRLAPTAKNKQQKEL